MTPNVISLNQFERNLLRVTLSHDIQNLQNSKSTYSAYSLKRGIDEAIEARKTLLQRLDALVCTD